MVLRTIDKYLKSIRKRKEGIEMIGKDNFLRNIMQWFKRLAGFLKTEDIHYIGGSEALPPPLTADEEGDLLNRLTQQDFNVKKTLIERNLRLVVYIARKFENTGMDIEDLTSIGTIGLIKAINTYNPARNIKLATYASRCIENEILMFLRKNSKLRSEVSIDEPLNVDWDGNELLLSDILGTDGDLIQKNLDDKIDRELLLAAMTKLSRREKKIMEMRFGLNNQREKTQKEVADMLGISQLTCTYI
jgi:RNA polymerase sporulation-specific sigma factor